MTTSLRATVLTDRPAVDALVPAWRELLADSASNEPTLAPEWLLSWWDVYGPHDGRQLRFVRFDADSRLVGLAPFLRRRHWYAPGVPLRRLEPLGSGERESEATCSDYLNVLARRGHEGGVAQAFAEALHTGALGRWDEVVMPLMDGEAPMPALLAEACQKRGLEATLTQSKEAPYIPLPRTWDDYLKALGRKERYLVNRTLRDFETWAGEDARFHRATGEVTREQGARILRELHSERWEGTSGGTFRAPRFLAFHERVMACLQACDALELSWLTVRGEPVAAMYSVRWNGKIHFYQCGRRMEVPKGIRPGGVILYHAIRSAIEQGLREFDFLGGVAVYKSQLALASRPLVELRIHRNSLAERLLRLVARSKDWLRPLVRRLRGKPPLPPPPPANSGVAIVPRPEAKEKAGYSLTDDPLTAVG